MDSDRVAASLQRLARVDGGPLPPAGIVFRKVQVRRRVEAREALAEHALRPLRIAEVAAAVLVIAAASLAWRWGGPPSLLGVGTMLLAPVVVGTGVLLAARR
jgi:hypothetical protein